MIRINKVGEIEEVNPDPKLIELIDKLVEQNEMILLSNLELISRLSGVPYIVRRKNIDKKETTDESKMS